MTQQERRANPYPWTWEIPTAVAVGLSLILAVGVQLGRAAANLCAGAGWQLPNRSQFLTSLPAVLRGDARAGLIGLDAPTATPPLLYAGITTIELVLVAGSLALLAIGLRRWGPARLKGMASTAEAARLLGPGQLRRKADIIRPDLGHQRHEWSGNGHQDAR